MNQSLVIVGRVLLLLVAAVAAASAFAIGRPDRAASSARAPYVCPMHPEVRSATAADCSICGMALERVTRSTRDVARPEVLARPERRVVPADARPAWVEASGLVAALLYQDELSDEPALFFPAARPADGLHVRPVAGSSVAWDRSTVRVRFHLDADGPAAKPGEVGWLALAGRPRERLVVPSGAVVHSPAGPHVLAVSADGTVTRRPIEIGGTARGFTVVLAGLGEQDRVVVGNTFFLDADRRLRAGDVP